MSDIRCIFQSDFSSLDSRSKKCQVDTTMTQSVELILLVVLLKSYCNVQGEESTGITGVSFYNYTNQQTSKNVEGRVVGGDIVQIADYPYVVCINNGTADGVIISYIHVLTSASSVSTRRTVSQRRNF